MSYEPDWKSKTLLALFGKKRLMTLLDTAELMAKEDFKSSPSYQIISNRTAITAVAANAAVIVTSILLSRTIFFKVNFFSPIKLLTDCSIVFLSYYAAAISLSDSLQHQVQLSKSPYLRSFDEDFMFHFNYISAKYQIDQKMQVQNIISDAEYEGWMNEFFQRTAQMNQ